MAYTMPLKYLLLLAFLAPLYGFAGEATDSAPDSIKALILRLGNDDYEVRKHAERILVNIGNKAIPQLQAAAKGNDIEIKLRAQRVLAVLGTEPLLRKLDQVVLSAKTIETDLTFSASIMNSRMNFRGHFRGMIDGSKYALAIVVNHQDQEISMKMVDTGKTIWSEIKLPNGVSVVQKFSVEALKGAVDPGMLMGLGTNPSGYIKDLRALFEFTKVREVKVGKRTLYLLEGAIKEGEGETMAKTYSALGLGWF